VHMNVESALVARVGEVGKKLHTARSRNDQVATDIRLYLRGEIDGLLTGLGRLMNALVTLAEQEADTLLPGFTHLQAAQPISFGHHLLAWNEMLLRDAGRLRDCRVRVNVLPLGAGALAGTTFPIDRQRSAALLGFDAVAENSLDAVSDRDFAIEFAAVASLIMVHYSRMAEELVLWNSQAIGFVDIADAFCTGSSMMPQKKNPDVPELVRGKAGRVIGHLVALITLMKAQPLAYNKDNQEDKEPLFDTLDTLNACTRALCRPGADLEGRTRAHARRRGARLHQCDGPGRPPGAPRPAVPRRPRGGRRGGRDGGGTWLQPGRHSARRLPEARRRARREHLPGAGHGSRARRARSLRRHGAQAGARRLRACPRAHRSRAAWRRARPGG